MLWRPWSYPRAQGWEVLLTLLPIITLPGAAGCGLWFSWNCLEAAAEIPKCVISHPAPPCTWLHAHSLERAKQTAMMASALLDWPTLPATKQENKSASVFWSFSGLTIGKATQKVLHSRLYCQLEHQWPQTVGPEEVLLSVNQLMVEIICFSREAGSWLLPPPPACSTNLMLSAAIKGQFKSGKCVTWQRQKRRKWVIIRDLNNSPFESLYTSKWLWPLLADRLACAAAASLQSRSCSSGKGWLAFHIQPFQAFLCFMQMRGRATVISSPAAHVSFLF